MAIDVLCTAIKRDERVAIDESLGLLGRLVAIHPTIIIEHYSAYLDLEDIDSCILRSAIYWELNKTKVDSSRKTRVTKDSVMNPQPLHLDRPFTWIFTAKCSENSLRRWNAIPDPEFGAHVYRLAAPGLSMGIVDIRPPAKVFARSFNINYSKDYLLIIKDCLNVPTIIGSIDLFRTFAGGLLNLWFITRTRCCSKWALST